LRAPTVTDSALQAVLTLDRRPDVFWLERGRSWAVRGRRGEAAKAIVDEALHLTDKAASEPLREAQAILNALGEPLLQMFQETLVNLDTMPESPAFRKLHLLLEARGEARGEARMVLQVLGLRGFTVDKALRERVMACTDRPTLERWHARAVTAATVDEVFADPAP